jgi:hypothetical protein
MPKCFPSNLNSYHSFRHLHYFLLVLDWRPNNSVSAPINLNHVIFGHY